MIIFPMTARQLPRLGSVYGTACTARLHDSSQAPNDIIEQMSSTQQDSFVWPIEMLLI